MFPPKRFVNRVAAHLAKYWMHAEFMLIFHAIGELPLSVANILSLGARIYPLSDINVSIIPAEKRLVIKDQVFMGFWNTRDKSSFAIINKVR